MNKGSLQPAFDALQVNNDQKQAYYGLFQPEYDELQAYNSIKQAGNGLKQQNKGAFQPTHGTRNQEPETMNRELRTTHTEALQ